MKRKNAGKRGNLLKLVAAGAGAGAVGLAAIFALVDHGTPNVATGVVRKSTAPVKITPRLAPPTAPLAAPTVPAEPDDGSELAFVRKIVKDEREAAQVWKRAAEKDPPRFARWLDEVASNATLPAYWLLGALDNLDKLSPAERVRFLTKVARTQADRVAAVEDRPDGALETVQRRAIAHDARTALLRELGPSGVEAMTLDPATDSQDRLLVAAAACEAQVAFSTEAAPRVARTLVHELEATPQSALRDEQRIGVVGSLPAEARVPALIAALEQPGLGDEAAHLAIGNLTSADAATLAAHVQTASDLACPRLALAYALATEKLPASPELERTGTGVSGSLERSVAAGQGAAARMALSILASSNLPGSQKALERLAAGEGGTFAREAQAIVASRRGT